MSVELSLPSELVFLESSSMGRVARGLQVTEMDTGGTFSRSWLERPMASYEIRPSFLALSGNGLDAWEQFLHQVGAQASPFWVTEPLSGTVREVLCGSVTETDGSRVTFPVPIASLSSGVYMKNGRVLVSYQEHSASNILTDNQAAATTDTTGVTAYGSCAISRTTAAARAGRACFLVDPTGDVANVGVEVPYTSGPSITAGRDYTFQASVRGQGTFELGVQYYNGSTPLGSFTTQATAAIDADAAANWVELDVQTKTAETGADSVRLVVRRTSTSTYNFLVDCLAVAPGDLPRWWLPSLSPPAVTLTGTTPAEGDRVTASGSGYRMARVRIQGNAAWGFKANQASIAMLRALEEVWHG